LVAGLLVDEGIDVKANRLIQIVVQFFDRAVSAQNIIRQEAHPNIKGAADAGPEEAWLCVWCGWVCYRISGLTWFGNARPLAVPGFLVLLPVKDAGAASVWVAAVGTGLISKEADLWVFVALGRFWRRNIFALLALSDGGPRSLEALFDRRPPGLLGDDDCRRTVMREQQSEQKEELHAEGWVL